MQKRLKNDILYKRSFYKTKMENKLSNIQFFSGSTLKMIAIITMMIDHIGAFLMIYTTPLYNNGNELIANAESWYWVMRQIGRTAFPIFCFLLVEGFLYTKDSFFYLARLMFFSVVSEVPFDIAVSGTWISWKNQNVFFTLALGLGMLMVLKAVMDYKSEKMKLAMEFLSFDLLQGGVVIIFLVLAELIQCDYGGMGIFLIAILYYTRNQRLLACVAGYLSFLWEPFCLPAFLLIPFYSGKRGKQMKYLFYAFYPVHLLVIVVFRYIWFGIPLSK